MPIAVGEVATDPGVRRPPTASIAKREAPAVYKMLATLPSGTVVAELPFGFPSWELRYVYYSSVHLHRLVNGYSGGVPGSVHRPRRGRCMRPLAHPEQAWEALAVAGVTHVVVHRNGFDDDELGGSRRLARSPRSAARSGRSAATNCSSCRDRVIAMSYEHPAGSTR